MKQQKLARGVKVLQCGLFVCLVGILAGFSLPQSAIAAEDQTGTGETSLTVRLEKTGEYGGSNAEGEYSNPDNDGDGLGDNLAFTVPTRIDFVAAADGTLTGPKSDTAFIKNESRYSVHVSSLATTAKNGWSIVRDASESNALNSVDIEMGPEEDRLNGADYLTKSLVGNPRFWNMAARGAADNADRVELSFSGHINNVDKDISTEATFGQINWYVTPGIAA